MFDFISCDSSYTNFLEMNTWVLKDRIKNGTICFEEGDEVVLFWRKGNGYPRLLKENEVYIVKKLESDHLYVVDKKYDYQFTKFGNEMLVIRVHKTYMIPIQILRDIKLNSLFDETK